LFAFLHLLIRVTVLLSPFLIPYTASSQIYTLSLHDALPIYELLVAALVQVARAQRLGVARSEHEDVAHLDRRLDRGGQHLHARKDRKSTRLNSSHRTISYAVFCLKKKKKRQI